MFLEINSALKGLSNGRSLEVINYVCMAAAGAAPNDVISGIKVYCQHRCQEADLSRENRKTCDYLLGTLLV